MTGPDPRLPTLRVRSVKLSNILRWPFWQLLRLGTLFALMALVWLTIYSIVVARAGNFLRRARVRRVLDGILGTVLVGFSARLLAAHR